LGLELIKTAFLVSHLSIHTTSNTPRYHISSGTAQMAHQRGDDLDDDFVIDHDIVAISDHDEPDLEPTEDAEASPEDISADELGVQHPSQNQNQSQSKDNKKRKWRDKLKANKVRHLAKP
jgi:hypothetical protein